MSNQVQATLDKLRDQQEKLKRENYKIHLERLTRSMKFMFAPRQFENMLWSFKSIREHSLQAAQHNKLAFNFRRFKSISLIWNCLRHLIKQKRFEAAKRDYQSEIANEKLGLAEEMFSFNLKVKSIESWKEFIIEARKKKEKIKFGDKIGVKVDSFKDRMREAREKAAEAQNNLEKLQREKQKKEDHKMELRKIRELRIEEAQRLKIGIEKASEDGLFNYKLENPEIENEGEDYNIKESGLSEFIHTEKLVYIEEAVNDNGNQLENELQIGDDFERMKESTEEERLTLQLRNLGLYSKTRNRRKYKRRWD